jgi:hypothetical protein
MTNSCTCKAERWQPHAESCPAYKPKGVHCPCGHLEDNDEHACPVTHARLRAEIERLRTQIEILQRANRFLSEQVASAHEPGACAVVNEQAEDEGLWFQPVYASEAYLQAALRRLHAAVEGASRDASSDVHIQLHKCEHCGATTSIDCVSDFQLIQYICGMCGKETRAHEMRT